MSESTLTLGMNHTNRWGLAEHLLMQIAGHVHWTAIAETVGMPLSALRTADGGKVYGTFYYVETEFPPGAPIESFQVDDAVWFRIEQRAYKGIAVEGQIQFDKVGRTAAASGAERERTPHIRFGNIFITPEVGNSQLRVAPPVNADFSKFPVLPNDENPYQITRAAAASGSFGLLEEPEWTPAGSPGGSASSYAIDPDRDTNGAGLVYFANYFAFLDAAERAAAADCPLEAVRTSDGRLVRSRRTAFYGNVDLTDRVRTHVRFFQRSGDVSLVGVRYAMHREKDDVVICLSEAIKRCVRA